MPDPGITQTDTWRMIKDFLSDCITYLKDALTRFFKWIESFFPKSSAAGWLATGNVVKVMIVIFALAAIALVAYILRKNKAPPDQFNAATSLPAASEWEEYAAKLTSAGRYREAIRAWYHALLVTHFRAGLLHFRKGRTNWEYCYALPHNITWRERFMDLTGFFEVEWYGKTQSEQADLGTYANAAQQVLTQARKGASILSKGEQTL
jgi:hypothetical protein